MSSSDNAHDVLQQRRYTRSRPEIPAQGRANHQQWHGQLIVCATIYVPSGPCSAHHSSWFPPVNRLSDQCFPVLMMAIKARFQMIH